jgi:hypothetical protein
MSLKPQKSPIEKKTIKSAKYNVLSFDKLFSFLEANFGESLCCKINQQTFSFCDKNKREVKLRNSYNSKQGLIDKLHKNKNIEIETNIKASLKLYLNIYNQSAKLKLECDQYFRERFCKEFDDWKIVLHEFESIFSYDSAKNKDKFG